MQDNINFNAGYKDSSAIVKDNTIYYSKIRLNNIVYMRIKSLNRMHIYDILNVNMIFNMK